MNLLIHCVVLVLLVVIFNCYAENYDNDTRIIELDEMKSSVLSRRKRFITFPDGSSFQLVFCTQNQGYLQVGDIVWFGNTAALAWELPSDPVLFDFFRNHKRVYDGNRRSDKNILFLDEMGKVIGKVPYRKRPIVNPAFAKRSVNTATSKNTISIKKMHSLSKEANCLKNLHKNSIQQHREERKELYMKIEKLLQTLGWNGRECVLRLLCEARTKTSRQGTFLEEIVRATFTLPKGSYYEGLSHSYDEAHGSRGDCSQLYPDCEDKNGYRLYE